MKVGIIYENDSTANSIRPIEIKRFLDNRGYETKLFGFNNCSYLKGYLKNFWIGTAVKTALCKYIILNNTDLIETMKRLAKVVEQTALRNHDLDVIICESILYADILTKDLNCLKIFDCATPFTDELKYSHVYDERYIQNIKEFEINIYENADYVSFHWETYKDYVIKNVYNGKNFFTLNWGCHPHKKRAIFKYPSKLIYLGNLKGYWINKEMLSNLARAYPNIDVYGSPKPNQKYGLKYKGFANDTEIMNRYQYGLITITNDQLRCEGFSAKHIEYLSFGLPVFVPEWRKHLDLLQGSIPYNESNFLDMIDKYSDEDKWNGISDIAYEQAKKLDWNLTLENLDRIIRKS